ncbi:hypothetical protein [Paenibacillus popilliae]|uniref:Predicted membrane protein n=1 Tax=Paenibacillus popilliae ATCC 14706 TaxID=1212764 RepID=M9LXN5_PAEPP|nr:hypothetical protein [Paenibacillus popilliae]GAC40794.1 predicted membrane protein [Paenibacillus popilliae ATCC 14706]
MQAICSFALRTVSNVALKINIGQGVRTEFDDMVINGDLNSRYAYRAKGGHQPTNLKEQLAMGELMSNPAAGKTLEGKNRNR